MKKDYRNLLLALLLLSFLIYFYCYLPNSKIVEGVANSCWGDTSTLRDSIATFGGGRETPEEGMEEQARKDAEAALMEKIPTPGIRSFALQNLVPGIKFAIVDFQFLI